MTRCFGRLPSTTHPLLTTEHSRTGGSAESDSDAFGRLNIRRVFFAPSGTSCWGSSHKSAASCVTLLFSTTPVCTSRVASLPHRRSSRMGSPTITGATRCGRHLIRLRHLISRTLMRIHSLVLVVRERCSCRTSVGPSFSLSSRIACMGFISVFQLSHC